MNSMPARSGRSLFFSVSSVGIRALAVFVVLCILTNALVPRFSIGNKDYSTLCQIMKSQSVIFEFFNFSSLPVKIVSELFNLRNGVGAPQSNKLPDNDGKNTSNTSTDFSITAPVMKDVSGKLSVQRWHGFSGNSEAIFTEGLGASQGAGSSGAPPGALLFLITAAMFLFARARSALPGDAAIVRSFAINKPNSFI